MSRREEARACILEVLNSELSKDPTVQAVREAVEAKMKLQPGDIPKKKFKKLLYAAHEDFKLGTEEQQIIISTLLSLGKAISYGPGLHKELKKLAPAERIVELQKRLRGKGAVFEGEMPTKEEIEQAREKKMNSVDMEGMDASAIITGSKRRVPDSDEEVASSDVKAASGPKKKAVPPPDSGSEEEMTFQ